MGLTSRVAVIAAWVALAGVGAAQPAAPAAPPGSPAAGGKAAVPPETRVDLNSASRAELKTLPGIGDREAKLIVAGRPWSTKIDLVAKGILPQGRYAAIRHRIVVLHPAMPAAKR